MNPPVKLDDGELYAGLLFGQDGEPDQHIVLMWGEAEGVTWKAASAWAAEIGGSLPTRREQALLSASLPEQFPFLSGPFKWDWYWSSDTDGPNYAWVWRPGDGFHHSAFDCDRARARAVRRVPLMECAA